MLLTSETKPVPPKLAFGNCEFCTEFNEASSSRFSYLYGTTLASRVMMSQDGIAVMPTIGQLFRGSLLLLPIEHVEMMADLPATTLSSMIKLLERIEDMIKPFGMPVAFEHGARCSTQGGCGVYHAHMHVVPVPDHIYCNQVLPSNSQQAVSLAMALQQLKDTDAYLLFRDTSGQTAFIDLTQMPKHYPSQYFRRALAEHFKTTLPWDWRTYGYEPSLVEVVNWFGSQGVLVG